MIRFWDDQKRRFWNSWLFILNHDEILKEYELKSWDNHSAIKIEMQTLDKKLWYQVKGEYHRHIEEWIPEELFDSLANIKLK